MAYPEVFDEHDRTLKRSAHAFEALEQHLNDSASSIALQIEILPSALCPPGEPVIVKDGNCVGVPKKLLALAYTHALGIVFKPHQIASGEIEATATAVRATSIVLLLAPEHLTAANLRKRYLLSQPSCSLPAALASEFHILDSFLTSPLPRHTKSPTLWSHRNWLLTQFLPSVNSISSICDEVSKTDSLPNQIDRSVPTALSHLSSETNVILRAATHHPRNYYAFRHLRLLLQQILPLHFPPPSTSPTEHQNLLIILALHTIPTIHAFCRDHHSDTSAWSALLFLLQSAQDAEVASKVLEDTMDMVRKWNWKGEAVWMFLRTVGAGGSGVGGGVAGDVRGWLERMAVDGGCVGGGRVEGEGRSGEGEMPKMALADLAKKALEWIRCNEM